MIDFKYVLTKNWILYVSFSRFYHADICGSLSPNEVRAAGFIQRNTMSHGIRIVGGSGGYPNATPTDREKEAIAKVVPDDIYKVRDWLVNEIQKQVETTSDPHYLGKGLIEVAAFQLTPPTRADKAN